MRTNAKTTRRQNIRYRIRAKIGGTAQKPRLSVFRSNTEIYWHQLLQEIKIELHRKCLK
jgi:ribosomal protein L18